MSPSFTDQGDAEVNVGFAVVKCEVSFLTVSVKQASVAGNAEFFH